jgi:hypothetical protein
MCHPGLDPAVRRAATTGPRLATERESTDEIPVEPDTLAREAVATTPATPS